MANQKISGLSGASDLNDAIFPGVQGGTTLKFSISLFDVRYAALFQPIDATLTSLAALSDDALLNLTGLSALDDDAGLVEQTGNGTFTQRAIGIAASTSIPTRANVDARHVLHVATVADLRALTSTTFGGSYVQTASYHASSAYADGIPKGGGVYWHDSSDTTTADNNSTVLVDATLPTGRRWKLLHEETVNLGQCGAYLDGTGIDTTPLNRLIALINAGSIEQGLIGPGIALIDDMPSTITVGGWALRGAGWGSSIIRMSSSAGDKAQFFQIGDASNSVVRWTISGIRFQNQNSSSLTGAQPQIWIRSSSQGEIASCLFEGAPQIIKTGDTSGNEAQRTVLNGNIYLPSTVDGVAVFEHIAQTHFELRGGYCADGSGSPPDITGITQANPAVVTYSGSDIFANGDSVFIELVGGMTEVNNLYFTVANVNTGAKTFELSGINSSGYTAYTSGGIATLGKPDARAIKFAADSGGAGIDGYYATGVAFNFVHNRIKKLIEVDVTGKGAANIYFTNCTLDGGTDENTWVHLDSGAGGTDTKRLHNLGFANCRISSSAEGRILRVDHDSDNLLSGISYTGGKARGGQSGIAYIERAATTDGMISVNFSGVDLVNAAAVNGGTCFETNAGGLSVTGCNVVYQAESNTNRWATFLKTTTATANKLVCTGNLINQISGAQAFDLSSLNETGVMNTVIRNNAGKPDPAIREVATTDATVTTLAQQALANDNVYLVTAWVAARQDATDFAAYKIEAVYNVSGGTATLGTSTTTVIHETVAGWTAVLDASGANARVRVTGAAGDNITWGLLRFDVQIIG